MSDIKIFRYDKNSAHELKPHSVEIEKQLQNQIERNLEAFLGVKFLSSEYSTGKTHAGRIDTLGIDENGSPVITEYKRSLNQNVINQSLFYMDWLLDHKADFTLLVTQKLGKEEAEKIDWDSIRLICIAGDFTRYDEYSIKLMPHRIELIKFRYFGDDLLLFERIGTAGGSVPKAARSTNAGSMKAATASADMISDANDSLTSGPADVMNKPGTSSGGTKTFDEAMANASEALRNIFDDLSEYATSLGDDVETVQKKHYIAFKRYKNFACVYVRPNSGKLYVYVKVDHNAEKLEPGFSIDVSKLGHFPGNVEITITSEKDLEKAKPLIAKSYEMN